MARSNSGPTRCGSRTTCAARRWNGSAAPRKLRSSRMLETVDLALPAGPEELRKLKIGTVAYLSGRIFTAREGAYKHAIEEGAGMPASREALGLRSEEHTSELQSLRHLVCRLLLEKKKKKQ